MKCVLFDVVGLVGKKWTIPLLQQVELHGGDGFNTLLRRMKTLSPKILAERLAELEDHGLVRKTTIKGVPLRTSYVLTKKGKDLCVALQSVRVWNEKYNGKLGCAMRDCTTCGH
ncbi:MAG: helix-turn-helix domain-containing protein [Nanoarchaeota archaeon]